MLNVCAEYSGVVIDQNVVTATLSAGPDFHYQTFRLPEDYRHGTRSDEQRFPSLSGFQLLVAIAVGQEKTATLNWTIDEYFFGSGWTSLAKGTVVGAQADGHVWMDVILDKEIPVDASMTTDVSQLRIGFQAESGIEDVFYAHPNPLPGFVEGFQSDGKTPLSPSGSFCFRLLGLTADSGTDFLGDPYRSVAVHTSAQAPVGGNVETGYWLSAPQPSSFAVTSHYSDVRPFPEVPAYGTINRIPNPSFEYDIVGQPPALWTVTPPLADLTPVEPFTVEEIKAGEFRQKLHARLAFSDYDSLATLNVINTLETPHGTHCLEVNTHEHPVKRYFEPEGAYQDEIQVGMNKPVTFSIWARTIGPGFKVALVIGDGEVGYEEARVEITSEWTRFSVTLTPVASGTTSVGVVIPLPADLHDVETPAHTFYLDGAMVNSGLVAASYIDGDSPSSKWENQRGRSGSVEIREPEVEDDTIVIDSVLLDPITPGVAFNVYYTTDLTGSEEEGEMTDEQWEQKLWIHVPQSFMTAVKTTYVLPEPIVAKFVKIEFSQLQARPYDPGDYQKPTQYKLFPDWVATPFLAEISTPAFVAKRVGVAYDALNLAYKPLLAGLQQGPLSPEHPELPPAIAGPAANKVDPETLERINLTINTYLQPPAARAHPLTLLGQKAAFNAHNQENYPVEGTPTFEGNPSIAVSGLDRQAIILDQSMPVMFFWVTCRHEYKELSALLEDNRAYFAGLNELAFIRNTYTQASDTSLYIETGADDVNTDRNDFVVEDLDWFTY
jgi:hypothetical protein